MVVVVFSTLRVPMSILCTNNAKKNHNWLGFVTLIPHIMMEIEFRENSGCTETVLRYYLLYAGCTKLLYTMALLFYQSIISYKIEIGNYSNILYRICADTFALRVSIILFIVSIWTTCPDFISYNNKSHKYNFKN